MKFHGLERCCFYYRDTFLINTFDSLESHVTPMLASQGIFSSEFL
jgi:hypothetical protein